MPWQARNVVELREELVRLIRQEGVPTRELCRRYGISPTTAYKWQHRHTQEGRTGLRDRSRRPHSSPTKTDPAVEALVVQLRQEHPCWGGRKLHRRLRDQGHTSVPPPSTLTAILHRHDLIYPDASEAAQPYQRFERPEPNDLWQMDFKGEFRTRVGWCHPLTILDDHSRYAVGLFACSDEQTGTVQHHLEQVFRRYGLPRSVLTDNGAPWGNHEPQSYTQLGVWLLRLGVSVIHGRPYHPQTQGKDERFHRTLKQEVLQRPNWTDLLEGQRKFDQWRHLYNHQRPHEALGLEVPAARYRASPLSYPDRLPSLEYLSDDIVRTVRSNGAMMYRSQMYHVGRAFAGQPIALRPGPEGLLDVFFGWKKIGSIDPARKNESKYPTISIYTQISNTVSL